MCCLLDNVQNAQSSFCFGDLKGYFALSHVMCKLVQWMHAIYWTSQPGFRKHLSSSREEH